MVAADGRLFSICLFLIPWLTQATAVLFGLARESNALSKDLLGLEHVQVHFPSSNATAIYRPDDFAYQSTTLPKYRRRSPRVPHHALQKRDNYCFSDDSSAFCPDSNLCCTDTAENTGWCCWFTLNCGTENFDCITPTVVFTSTSTVTSEYSVYITLYSTTFDTEVITETITRTHVVTESNVATATEVQVTTITSHPANEARHLLTTDVANPQSAPYPVPSSTYHGDVSSFRNDPEKNPITTYFEPSRDLRRRQAITSTDIVVETITLTITVSVTSVIDSTIFTTTTTIDDITTTSALNAQTTVQVTSTYTFSDTPRASTSTSSSNPTGASTLPQDSSNGDGGRSGLGGGAVAGIAIGTAAGALIIAGLIAFFLYRRRQKTRPEAYMPATPGQGAYPFSPIPDQYQDKMAPAAAYDPRSRPVSLPYDYDPVPNGAVPQIYHEVDGRMLESMPQIHELPHPPVELAAHGQNIREANEVSPHQR